MPTVIGDDPAGFHSWLCRGRAAAAGDVPAGSIRALDQWGDKMTQQTERSDNLAADRRCECGAIIGADVHWTEQECAASKTTNECPSPGEHHPVRAIAGDSAVAPGAEHGGDRP